MILRLENPISMKCTYFIFISMHWNWISTDFQPFLWFDALNWNWIELIFVWSKFELESNKFELELNWNQTPELKKKKKNFSEHSHLLSPFLCRDCPIPTILLLYCFHFVCNFVCTWWEDFEGNHWRIQGVRRERTHPVGLRQIQ